MKEFLKKIYGWIVFPICWLFPLKNKVVFSCFSGKRYGDNPKYISCELQRKNPEIQQIWFYKKKPFDLPEGIEQVKWGSFKMSYHLATSKVWVDSHTKPIWVQKRKGQFYIETWHGGLGFKKIEGDASEKLPKGDIKRIQHNSAMIDLLLSNSDWLTKIYKRAFWYSGKILKTGFPKSDYLIHYQKGMKQKVLEYYHLPKDAKIVLYAPTMRMNPSLDVFDIHPKQLLNTLEQKFSGNWYFLIRFHPVNEEFSKKIEYDERILNGTKYFDMQDLIGAANVYISDYSGSIFDSALIYHPTFIFASDEEEYQNERGLYMDIRSLPFLVANNNEELCENIRAFDEKKYIDKLNDYFKKTGLYEPGDATKKIVDIILEHLK